MQAQGGVGALQGEDGTIVWNGAVSGLGDEGSPMTTAVVTGRHYLSDTQSYTFENLVVASGGQLVLKGNYTGAVTVLDSLTVESGGEIYVERYGALTIGGGDVLVSGQIRGSGLALDVMNLTVDDGAFITSDGLGYRSGGGPGGGHGSYSSGGGAGYGGVGGRSWQGVSGGPSYPDALSPTALGSGGGSVYQASGGSGGGTIRIDVSGVFALDGDVSSDGSGGGRTTHRAAGGGSGGSIWIAASSFSGEGRITANGGSGGQASYYTGRWGGGGAGGRIAIYFGSNTFTGVVTAVGGGGAQAGGQGTIHTEQTVHDDDADGIENEIEDAAPNGGDGNADGILDSAQGNVASLPNVVNAGYVTLVSPAGTGLAYVAAVDNPSPGDAPAGVEFPIGFFEFTVVDVTPGASVDVLMIDHSGTAGLGTYYKYGPTPDDPADHWYEFAYDDMTGAELDGNVITLHFVDGARGDGDLAANGEVVEPGGPGVPPNAPPVIENQDFAVDENSDVGTVVGTAVASDPDLPGDALIWSITGGNTDGAFGINSTNGEITVANKAALDFETTPVFNLTVEVEDSYGETDDATISIDVKDVETKVALLGGNLTISDVDGGTSDDTLSIARDAGELVISDPNNIIVTEIAGATGSGTNAVSVPVAGVTQITVDTLGGSDSLAVDLGGSFGVPINYNAGASGGDSLDVIGSGLTATLVFANETDGSVDVDGQSIVYTGLTPVDMTGADVDNLVLSFTSTSNEIITLSDDGTIGDNNSQIDSTAGQLLTFATPNASLTVQTGSGGGADSINVQGLDAAWDANLNIAGDSDDTVDFQTNTTDLGGGSLDVEAETITIKSGITTTGAGSLTVEATRHLSVESGATVSLVDGDLTLRANQGATRAPGSYDGLVVSNATLEAQGSGNITLVGRAGTGTADEYRQGIILTSNGLVSARDGQITLVGTGGTGDGTKIGVTLNHSASIESSGIGNITVTGTGESRGIFAEQGGTISATGTGSISLNGTTEPTGKWGVYLLGSSGTRVESNDGDITITGTGGTKSGVLLRYGANVSSTGAGSITIDGTAGSAGRGIRLHTWPGQPDVRVATVDGDITFTGTGATQGGIFLHGGPGESLSIVETVNGDITFTGAGSTSSGNGSGIGIGAGGKVLSTGTGSIALEGTGGAGGYGNGVGVASSAALGGVSANGGGIAIDGTALGTGKGVSLKNALVTTTDGGSIDITGTASASWWCAMQANSLDAGEGTVTLTTTRGKIWEADVAAGQVVINGEVDPGAHWGQGQISINGNLSMNSAEPPGDHIWLNLDGTAAGTQYDQIQIHGAGRVVALNGARMSVDLDFNPVAGDEFVIIDNVDSTSSVVGKFRGLPEGKAFTVDGTVFHIFYHGGTDNNDVVLIANRPPEANDDAESTDEDTSLDVPARGVLANDSDPDGDRVIVSEVNGSDANVGTQITLASGALLTVQKDGSFSYDPNGQFEYLAVGETANDGFTYTASDRLGGTDTVAVSITIDGVNDAPVADDAELTIAENTDELTLVGTVTASDVDASDSLTFDIISGNTADAFAIDDDGVIAVNNKAALDFETTPVFNLTVQVDDGNGGTDTAAVTVNLADRQATVSIDDNTGFEGDTGATTSFGFVIALSGDVVNVPFGVGYATADDSATAASGDYVDIVSELASFAGTVVGETQAVEVTVNGDHTVESNETFLVNLNGIVGTNDVTIAGFQGKGTIENDDSAMLSITAPSITETDGNQTVQFTVEVDAAVQGGFDVAFDITLGTAETDDLIVETPNPLSLAGGAGEKHYIDVTIVGDDLAEDDETFTITLGDVTNTSAVQDAAITTGDSAEGTIVNDDYVPVPHPGGPYVIDEGDPLTLDARLTTDQDSDPAALTYRWDVDGDGDYDEDVTGINPTVPLTKLLALGLADGPHGNTVTVKASDGTNAATASTTLTINNVAPVIADLTSGAESCGNAHEDEPVTLDLDFTDPGLPDVHTVFIEWGDGQTDVLALPVGDRSLSIDHVYADGGVYTIDVTVSDDDSGVDSAAVRAVVSGVGLHEVDGENVLQIIGTSGGDHLTLNRTGNGTLKVHADFIEEYLTGDTRDFNLADVDRIFALMCSGDDHVNVSSKIALDTLIHGSSGNDHLNGGGGSNLILGGSGNDHINGGTARDVLIGGDGEDRIVGNPGEDMLVGGRLAEGVGLPDLLDLLDRWNEDIPFADRVADLQDEIDSIFVDDGDLDTLTGASGEDWFILGEGDTATDSSSKNGGGGSGSGDTGGDSGSDAGGDTGSDNGSDTGSGGGNGGGGNGNGGSNGGDKGKKK